MRAVRGGETGLADLVGDQMARWDGRLEQAVLRTEDPAEVAAALEAVVAPALGPPSEAIFYVTGVGIVAGLRLGDGRAVVVKVHRGVGAERLVAMQRAQSHFAHLGLPVPRPVLAPTTIGRGLATVEEHRPGARAHGRDREVRRMLATELHRLVEAGRNLDGAGLERALVLRSPGPPLYPEPHSVRFDFARSTEGAAWIDELAEHARTRLDAVDQADVVGHFDWRVQNVAVDAGGQLVAVYDSDSFGLAPEAVVVGCAAGGFCVDWDAAEADPLPTLEELRGFVADYEAARGAPFEAGEREALDAANLAMVAYGARCQHSDLLLEPRLENTPDVGWFRLLRERGERCLAD